MISIICWLLVAYIVIGTGTAIFAYTVIDREISRNFWESPHKVRGFFILIAAAGMIIITWPLFWIMMYEEWRNPWGQ